MTTDIAFVDTTHGYGLLWVHGGSVCSDRVGYTSDGGSHFESTTTVVSWSCDGVQPASALAFDTHGDGFLFGPDLFITHDGGRSWAKSPRTSAVHSVVAFGNSIWVLEGGCGEMASATQCPTRLRRSDNGGRSWASSLAPSGATSLVRTGLTSGYVMAESSGPANAAGSGTSPMWLTVNSGATWQSRPIACWSFAQVAVWVAPDETLFAVCGGEGGMGAKMKETVRSVDGGRHWSVQSTCHLNHVSGVNCTPGVPLGGYLGEIDAVSSSRVYLVGDRSSLTETRNGGVTWSPVQPLLGDTSDGTLMVNFFSPSEGVVLGFDGRNNDVSTLWTTTDGGERWVAHVASIT